MITPDDIHVLSIFGGIAGALFASGFCIWRAERAPRHWPQAAGLIVTSTTRSHPAPHGGHTVAPVIEYEFTYDGRSFRSSHWRRIDFVAGDAASAAAATSAYPVGAPVTVFVHPRNPAKSVVHCRSSGLCWVPFGFGLLFAALTALLVCGFLGGARK